METTIRVCHNRCPADYGKVELLQMIEARFEADPDVTLINGPCLLICKRLGGAATRPECGIGNFEEIVNGQPTRQGVFMINEDRKIIREYLPSESEEK